MVTPGAESKDRATPEQVASYTLKLLRNRIPPAVPGIMASLLFYCFVFAAEETMLIFGSVM